MPSVNTLAYPRKLQDTSRAIPGGRVDRHWRGKLLQQVFNQARKGSSLPSKFEFWNPEYLLEYFNARGFEFGNWLNQADRYEYLIGCGVSLYDLAQIVNLDHRQMGLGGHLTFAFGARGKTPAIAHFEPSNWAINLTRYKEETKGLKAYKYLESGGAGSLAHEWMHALDQYLYYYHDQQFQNVHMLSDIIDQFMIPIKDSDRHKKIGAPNGKAARVMLDLMIKICYRQMSDGNYVYSDFYGSLLEVVKEKSNGYGEYWIRPHEILARSFEVFVFNEGKRKGISNPFLKKTKYSPGLYPSVQEYRRWAKDMRRLLSLSSSEIRYSDHSVTAFSVQEN